jgi:hypothetical protein
MRWMLVNFVVKSFEQACGDQMGLNLEGFDLRAEIILEEPAVRRSCPEKFAGETRSIAPVTASK